MNKRKLTKLFKLIAATLLILSLYTPMQLEAQTRDDKHKILTENIQAQENQLKRKGDINPKLMNKTSLASADEEVSIIVQLSEAPIALEKGKKKLQGHSLSSTEKGNLKRKITNQQRRIFSELKRQNIKHKTETSYLETINALVLSVNKSDLEKIANIPGVVSIDPNEEMQALEGSEIGSEVNSNDHLNIPEIWSFGHEGEGIKVGVIDTGIDYYHPELIGVYKGGNNFVQQDDQYTRPRADDDPYETTPDERAEHAPITHPSTGSSFFTSHGTHVAGIIAAAGKNDFGIKGVAPKVDLYAYRVLGAYGSGQTSWVIAGIEQSVIDGMDVINLSLGGGSNSELDPSSIAVNNATLAGVTVVSATGNSGPGRGSIGTPATSTLGIAVGNSTLPETLHSATVTVEAGDYRNESDIEMMAWTFGLSPEEAIAGSFDLVAIPGYGTAADFEGIDAEGKVALISRGEVPFVDKIDAAREAGAIATLIHNNDGEGPADVYLGDSFVWIPSFDMATEEGTALREALEEAEGSVTFTNFEQARTEGDEVNASSSRGPTMPNYEVKPDVVAPGTNIMAPVPAYGLTYPNADYSEAYDRKSGTSMAAPQVAGIAALLLSANKDWDPYDVKVALSNTAKILDKKFDVFTQGAGLVQPVEAIKAKTRAYVKDTFVVADLDRGMVVGEIETKKGSFSFGRITPDPEEEIKITKQIHIEGLAGNYDVYIEEAKVGSGASLSLDKDSISLKGKETINVILTIDPGEDIPGNEFLGYVHIKGKGMHLSLPYSVELSEAEPFGVTHFYLDDYALHPFDPNKVHSTELHFGILHDENQFAIEVFDLENPTGGYFGDGYIGVLAIQALAAGNYKLGIKGDYVDWLYLDLGLPISEPIPDGVYSLDYSSWQDHGIDTLASEGPFFIKRTDPNLSLHQEEESKDILGEIDDKFVDYMPVIENSYERDFDLNDYLFASYTLERTDGTLEEESFLLNQDGSFTLSLAKLSDGDILTITVEDLAENTSSESITIGEFSEPDPEPEEIIMHLSSSPDELTEGPVEIYLGIESSEPLVSARWLKGKKEAEDFIDAGEEIDLDSMSFTVDENGYYTVFVENDLGVTAVESIPILNILDPDQGSISAELYSEEAEDEDGREVAIIQLGDIYHSGELEALQWMAGARTIADFESPDSASISALSSAEALQGEPIDPEERFFTVYENGIYTVYIRDSEGERGVFLIEIDFLPVLPKGSDPGDGNGDDDSPGDDNGDGTDPGDGNVDDDSPGDDNGDGTDPGDGNGNDDSPGDDNGDGSDPGDGNGDDEVPGNDNDDENKGKKDSTDKDDLKTPNEKTSDPKDQESDALPKTATPWYNLLLFGGILLALGVVTLMARRLENKLYSKE